MATLLLLLLLTLSFSLSLSFSDDESALLAFKSYVTSDPADVLAGWSLAGGPHCAWRGVSCDAASHVISLDLSGTMAISGEIHPAIGDLHHLKLLDLHGNNFSGEIPLSIANLSSLQILDLSLNSLSGGIPESLIGFSRLESIDLSSNHLTGRITTSSTNLCRSLLHLNLSNNFLQDKIPPGIGKCVKLKTLLLNGNILEGRIPPEIGRIAALRILDVSRNSLTGSIPKELANCKKLYRLVLTNLDDSIFKSSNEFNAFKGGIPHELLVLTELEVLWAPRANLGGSWPELREGLCKLRVINVGQNYINGFIPGWLSSCRSLSFLDLSSNGFQGLMPPQLAIHCMLYFNVSHNLLAGYLEEQQSSLQCRRNLTALVEEGDQLVNSYCVTEGGSGNHMLLHDFSWNNFTGALPSLPLKLDGNFSYSLFLNGNGFNGSFPGELLGSCEGASEFRVNLSSNHLSGEIGIRLSGCLQVRSLEIADNALTGSIPPEIGDLGHLELLDLRENYLNGSIPDQLGNIASLVALDLSRNSLTGSIPQSFSKLTMLEKFNVSFNNLSGGIPHLWNINGCDFFIGNQLLRPCAGLKNASLQPSSLPSSHASASKWSAQSSRLKSFEVAAVASASVLLFILLALLVYLVCSKRKLTRVTGLRRKVVVTFTEAPSELNYENVVRATGNFSIQKLIGTGGFGATYKAELASGFLVAVKRLSIGRFQGLQQFGAEIRTLGRIRHKNLVTLIGYYMGESDMFLIYNYLPGGNLETFIHEMPSRNVKYPVVHKIALDVAQALAYLHYSCVPRIVHRDIKPSNILLDEKLNAYLSDFGLARLLEVSETHATTDVAGTFGYVAPEYATTCRVSDKADVYSFGVVLLELMSGKRSLDPSFSEYGNGFTIVTWGRLLIQEGRSGEVFAPSLWEAGPQEHLVSMLRLALACTVESLSVRPSMKQVAETLKHLRN
ncbi:putative protein kinase RLK-Pelle-LRR-XV family [Dioscorea sansibarensis]